MEAGICTAFVMGYIQREFFFPDLAGDIVKVSNSYCLLLFALAILVAF